MSSSVTSFLSLSLISAVTAKSFAGLSIPVSSIIGFVTFGVCFVVQPLLPDDSKKSRKRKKGKRSKKVVESSSDESSDDSSDEDSSSSEEEEPVPVKKSKKNKKKSKQPPPPPPPPEEPKLSKNQLKKKRARERKAAAAEEERKKVEAEKAAAAAEEAKKAAAALAKAKQAKRLEEARKAAESGKKLSKKQKKKLAAAERLRKEEEAAAAAAAKKKGKKKNKKQTGQEKVPEEVAQPQKAQEKKKKGKKQAAPEPEELAEEVEEDSDGWEKVPSRKEKKKRGRAVAGVGGNAPASQEGNSQLPTGPIVQEILELGSKPINPKDDDQIKKKIFDVLGFPTRRSRDDDDSIEDDSKFGRNVRLFKSKLNVHMEFNETKSKYYLIMNGSAGNCQDAIRAANQLFEKGYSDILTPGMTQISFPVLEKDRGAVVGKGGANMQAIQDEYCVQIRLPARNGNSDLVTLSGPTEGVEKAKNSIMQLISTGISDVTHPDSAVAEVLIPNRRKAALIGTRGSNIQRIQREYNCRVNVPQNVPGQRPNDKVSVVIAGEKALIDAAVADVKESVAEPEPEQIPGFSKELTCEYDPWAED